MRDWGVREKLSAGEEEETLRREAITGLGCGDGGS